MNPVVAKEFFQFVMGTLPNLLSKHGDPMLALESLGQAWKENRSNDIQDRDEQVAENRAEVDDKLSKRKAAAKKAAATRKRKAQEKADD